MRSCALVTLSCSALVSPTRPPPRHHGAVYVITEYRDALWCHSAHGAVWTVYGDTLPSLSVIALQQVTVSNNQAICNQAYSIQLTYTMHLC